MKSFTNVNEASHQTLEWILSHSDSGFFSVIASESMQSHVVESYKHCNIAVYDYLSHPQQYRFSTIESWISAQPDKDAYFLLNLQQGIAEEAAVKRLNFSRDMLARLNKNIIFCMTQDADDLLNQEAYDLYSFFKLVVFFQDETVQTPEKPVFDSVTTSFQNIDKSEKPDIKFNEQ